MKLSSADWIELIELGVSSVTQLLDARAKRRAALAAKSPELAAMSLDDLKAVFAKYYTAEDELAHAAAALVEAGAAEKGGGQ